MLAFCGENDKVRGINDGIARVSARTKDVGNIAAIEKSNQGRAGGEPRWLMEANSHPLFRVDEIGDRGSIGCCSSSLLLQAASGMQEASDAADDTKITRLPFTKKLTLHAILCNHEIISRSL